MLHFTLSILTHIWWLRMASTKTIVKPHFLSISKFKNQLVQSKQKPLFAATRNEELCWHKHHVSTTF